MTDQWWNLITQSVISHRHVFPMSLWLSSNSVEWLHSSLPSHHHYGRGFLSLLPGHLQPTDLPVAAASTSALTIIYWFSISFSTVLFHCEAVQPNDSLSLCVSVLSYHFYPSINGKKEEQLYTHIYAVYGLHHSEVSEESDVVTVMESTPHPVMLQPLFTHKHTQASSLSLWEEQAAADSPYDGSNVGIKLCHQDSSSNDQHIQRQNMEETAQRHRDSGRWSCDRIYHLTCCQSPQLHKHSSFCLDFCFLLEWNAWAND